jgi:hypothetical protein
MPGDHIPILRDDDHSSHKLRTVHRFVPEPLKILRTSNLFIRANPLNYSGSSSSVLTRPCAAIASNSSVVISVTLRGASLTLLVCCGLPSFAVGELLNSPALSGLSGLHQLFGDNPQVLLASGSIRLGRSDTQHSGKTSLVQRPPPEISGLSFFPRHCSSQN